MRGLFYWANDMGKTTRLTEMMERFCQGVASGKPQIEAYRAAYNAENQSDDTVSKSAYRLMEDERILARIAEIRAPAVAQAQYTLQQHLDRLNHLSHLAEADGKYQAAVTAETNRGRTAGFYVERVDVTSDGQQLGVVVVPEKTWGDEQPK